MTDSDQPPHRPNGHSDSTRPAARAGTRRGADRRPYPSAPTHTRPSPARPNSSRTDRHYPAAAPTPATVWAPGPTPSNPDAPWPTPILTTIITSFSQPGQHVLLLPWPTAHPAPDTATSGRPIDHARGGDDDLTAAVAAITTLNRTAHVLRVHPNQTPPRIPTPQTRPEPADATGPPIDTAPNPDGTAVPDVDLIITSLPPRRCGDHTSDQVALLAARRLRLGGILTVLTHCDRPRGDLIDPTGPMATSAQNADLLYLQHIVALHTPIPTARPTPVVDGSAAVPAPPHHQPGRGSPAAHRRIHSDVLVFAQPHDHQPPQQPPPLDHPDGIGAAR